MPWSRQQLQDRHCERPLVKFPVMDMSDNTDFWDSDMGPGELCQSKKTRRATWEPCSGRATTPYATSFQKQYSDTVGVLAPRSLPFYGEPLRTTPNSEDQSNLSGSSRSPKYRHSLPSMVHNQTFSDGSLKSNPLRLANIKRWDPQNQDMSSWDGLRQVGYKNILYFFYSRLTNLLLGS
jgi:hypothetical protein